MNTIKGRRHGWLAACMGLLVGLSAGPNWGQEAVQPDSLRVYATLHALGFEWDVSGDEDHDALCSLRYRVKGESRWREALGLLRVDFDGFYASQKADRSYNMLAGSVLFLQPGTEYEVELVLEDPDGGGVRRVVTATTRPAPALAAGDLVYVHPEGAAGTGTMEHPLRLETALAEAVPGRVYCLLPGIYGEGRIERSGMPGRPIAWVGPQWARTQGIEVPQGEAVLRRLEVTASHVWIEGLHFDRGTAWPDSVTRGGLKGRGPAAAVVVRGNRFTDYAYSIWLEADNQGWIISDNTIVGRKDIEQEGSAAFAGEGIELQHSSGHTVAYNSISQVADGISYAQRNVDIFGNDIFDTSDDGIEPDYGYANIRMWGNRIANVQYHAFSFQGMFCGPWYFVRNQVTTARGAVFKFRVTDRFVLVNNTFVAPTFGRDIMHHLLHAYARNNLFVRDGSQARDPWRARHKYRGESIEKGYYNPDLTAPDWRTDWDYSGYDLRGGEEGSDRFFWFDRDFGRLEDLAAAVGIERHGRHVEREDIFAQYQPPTHPARRPGTVLKLRPGGAAVDAGAPVPNLADQFNGSAPDLGAFEQGGATAQFGPRPVGQRSF